MKDVLSFYLSNITKARFTVTPAGAKGPDFELEDGSAIEAKGTVWSNVAEVLSQLAEYYMHRTRVGFAVPSDALNADRAYRLMLLEVALIYSKLQGEPIKVYCVGKANEKTYRLYIFSSVKDLYDKVTNESIRHIRISWYLPSPKKIDWISSGLKAESNELFSQQLQRLVDKQGLGITLEK